MAWFTFFPHPDHPSLTTARPSRFTYLAKKLPLPDAARDRLMDLRPGHALVFASQHRVRAAGCRLPPPPLWAGAAGPAGAGEREGSGPGIGEEGCEQTQHVFQVPTHLGLSCGGRFSQTHRQCLIGQWSK